MKVNILKEIERSLDAEQPTWRHDVDAFGQGDNVESLDDAGVFERICLAIFSAQARWSTIQAVLPAIRHVMLDYDHRELKKWNDVEIRRAEAKIRGLGVISRFLHEQLEAVVQNCGSFAKIVADHDSAMNYIHQTRQPRMPYEGTSGEQGGTE